MVVQSEHEVGGSGGGGGGGGGTQVLREGAYLQILLTFQGYNVLFRRTFFFPVLAQ